MPFDERLKVEVRRNAHFACCLCHDLGVEIHHIVPEGEGGPNDSENAAPLCPTCHERYGANPTKRKFIREARDLWFEVCAERYASDGSQIAEVQAALSKVATKSDIENAVSEMKEALTEGASPPVLPPGLADKEISVSSLWQYLRLMYPIVAHSGADDCQALVDDLTAIGYAKIGSLHRMIGVTSVPFAEVIREQRDRGEARFDYAGDIWPVRLFLAVLDENYCKEHYAALYQREYRGEPDRWRRRIGEPVPDPRGASVW